MVGGGVLISSPGARPTLLSGWPGDLMGGLVIWNVPDKAAGLLNGSRPLATFFRSWRSISIDSRGRPFFIHCLFFSFFCF